MPDPLSVHGPDRPRGLVLMLHGGAEHSERPVDHRSLSLRRTQLMFAAIQSRVADAGCALGLLRFTVRGWNARLGEPAPVAALAGRQVVGAHGHRDRITSARHTRSFLARAEEVAASTTFVDMGQAGHYMLTHVRSWNRTALKASLGMLAGQL